MPEEESVSKKNQPQTREERVTALAAERVKLSLGGLRAEDARAVAEAQIDADDAAAKAARASKA